MNGAYRQYLQVPTDPAPQPGTVSGGGAGGVAPSGHRGYADFRNSLGRHLPTQLERSRRTGASVLQMISHRHKVKG